MPLSEDLANLAQMIDHRRRDKVPPSDALLHELARALECHGGRAREMERRVEDLEVALCGDRHAELRLGRNRRLRLVPSPAKPKPAKTPLHLVIDNGGGPAS